MVTAGRGLDAVQRKYDGDGNRLQERVAADSTTVRFLWDVQGGLPRLIRSQQRVDASTDKRRYYLHGPRGIAAEISGSVDLGTTWNNITWDNFNWDGLTFDTDGWQNNGEFPLNTPHPNRPDSR